MDIVTYALLNGKIKDYANNVDEWLEKNVDPATGYVLDRSLQMENAAAPADMVGDINGEVGNLKNTLNHKADVIYDTASGDIASFPDGADGMPVKALTIDGAESATVTRAGKNLLSLSNVELGGTNPRTKSVSIETIPPGTYYFSAVRSGTVTESFGIQFLNNNTFVGGVYSESQNITLTDTANRAYAYMSSEDYSDGKTLVLYSIQLELGSIATAYEPYQSNTFAYPSETVITLYGVNNIWSDVGSVDVEYLADTKLYIQKINTPSDDDMIADANIASGKYFIVNNNLYISTAAILAGDPIKPGTNCTLTNLAAALNAINS